MTTHKRRVAAEFAAVVTSLLVVVLRTTTSSFGADDPWAHAEGYTRRLDAGKIAGEPLDLVNPPALALWLLSYNGKPGKFLRASADYHNTTATPKKIRGRIISCPRSGHEFYPYVRIEVSDSPDGEWRVIGRSPVASGSEKTILMNPDTHGLGGVALNHNRSCSVDMNAFRPFVGKLRFGRVALDDGGFSQVFALDDLLPPKEEHVVPGFGP
jgi:hypothetical protein